MRFSLDTFYATDEEEAFSDRQFFYIIFPERSALKDDHGKRSIALLQILKRLKRWLYQPIGDQEVNMQCGYSFTVLLLLAFGGISACPEEIMEWPDIEVHWREI